MDTYTSNTTLKQIAELLLKSDAPVLMTHAKPDGDAFGSVVSLARSLQIAGKRPRVLLVPPVPMSFSKLQGANIPELYNADQPLPETDLYVILDTGAWSQIAPIDTALRDKLDKLVIVDHHLSGDIPAAHRYIDGKAAACTEIVAQLIEALIAQTGQDLTDATVCEQIFVGIASDTGWFRFSNTRPQTHELAAKLLRKSVNQSAIYETLEQTDRPEKILLMQRALDSLKFLADKQAAVMVVGADDFTQTGARLEETERLIDMPRTVAGLEVVAMIAQPPAVDGNQPAVRVSFRSRPGDLAVNVAQVASTFGGGGHARAAGAKIDAPVEEVVQRVSQAIEEAVAAAKNTAAVDQSA